MKTRTDTRSGTGSALLTVMLMVMILSGMVTGVMSMSLTRATVVRRLTNDTRALAIAEAGANHAYSVLSTNFSARTNAAAFPSTAYAGGVYDATVTPVGSSLAVIESLGQCGLSQVTVMLDAKRFREATPAPVPPPGSAWEKGLYANGQATVNGDSTVGGYAHANAAFRVNGNYDLSTNEFHLTSATSVKISGNVYSPGTITAPTVSVTGSSTNGTTITETSVTAIPFPALDLTPLYNIALDNGQVRSGGMHRDSDWSSVPGGVLWFNGNLKIAGTTHIKGVVIATGNITISGDVEQELDGSLGGIVSRDGRITFNGGYLGEGLLYAPGDIVFNATDKIELTGQVVSGEDVMLNGDVDLLGYAYRPLDVNDTGTRHDLVGISAWQK